MQYVAPPFCDRFSWCVASFVLMCSTSFWSCISHFLYFAVRVFSVCVLLRISCSLSRFLFTFVVAYVFFSATSSSIRKFSSLFLCLFVNVIEVKTLVFSSLFPREASIASTHGTCFYHRFFWFEFRIHDNGISVLFCLQISVRDVHTWRLLNGRRPLSSCYLELVIRGSMA